jgi:3-deoxy-manno-octulosonate cytidylyltransferase (CMP-KDO synthetase)
MKPEKNNRIVCIIPARYESTRLPGKPLIEIKGLPLVMWTYNRAIESDAFNDVYIATDDRRIEEIVKQYNGKSIMTSSSHTSGTDRIFEAIQSINCGYIVNLQGDEPQIPVSILKEFAENIVKINNSSLLTCVSNATIEDIHNPDVVKVVLAENGDALYFSRAAIPFTKDGLPCKRYRHMILRSSAWNA